MTLEWTALPAGAAISTIATLAGFGGGILWMPYLIYLIRLDPEQAVVTSLIIQVCGMGSGTFSVIKDNKTDLRLSLRLITGSFLGGPDRGMAVQVCSGEFADIHFGSDMPGHVAGLCLRSGRTGRLARQPGNVPSDSALSVVGSLLRGAHRDFVHGSGGTFSYLSFATGSV